MRKKICIMAAALCAVVFMCGFSVTAYAGGGEEYGDPTMTAETEEASVTEEAADETEDNPFTPSGTGTVVDTATDEDGKEFYTIVTPAENVFYLVIDRQRETDNVYFLNAVTEADLLALAEFPEETVTATPEPTPASEPVTETEPEQEQAETSGNTGTLLLVAVVVLVGGGAGWYFKIYRPKQQQSGMEEDVDYGADESDPYDQDAETEDDGPPWYEDDGDGSAGYGDDDE